MNVEELKKRYLSIEKDAYKEAGASNNGRLERNGHFYHVVQRGRNRENVYDDRSAKYRHDLLCRLCTKYGVGVVFSVTMPNHTHDLLYADDWRSISKVVQILNSQVSRFIRRNNPARYKVDGRVFDERPVYVAVKNMRHLSNIGKYIYENFAQFERQGKFVPFSCFFGMRKGYVPSPPYRKDLYEFIYGMDVQQLCAFFEDNSAKDIERHVAARFSSWTTSDFETFFKVNPSVPWLSDDELI